MKEIRRTHPLRGGQKSKKENQSGKTLQSRRAPTQTGVSMKKKSGEDDVVAAVHTDRPVAHSAT